jgi:hypothetical protein
LRYPENFQRPPRPDDEVKLLRDDLDHLPGLLASQRRLRASDMRIYPAWNSLELGIDVEAALEYIERPLQVLGLPKEKYAKLVGIVLGFERQRESVPPARKELKALKRAVNDYVAPEH